MGLFTATVMPTAPRFGIGGLLKLMAVVLVAAAGTLLAMNHGYLNEADRPHQSLGYFMAHGLTQDQAAGIVGNLMADSHVNPADVKPYSWGVAGWKEAELDQKVEASLKVQLDTLWAQLNGPGANVLAAVRATSTLHQATDAYMEYSVPIETVPSPGDRQTRLDQRLAYAQQLLD